MTWTVLLHDDFDSLIAVADDRYNNHLASLDAT